MDVKAIAEALGLKRAGSEYKGPCPLCGGHDRFHIKQGQSADLILLCRYGCRYADIMRELENRGLVPKGDFKPTQYRQSDLSYCDVLMMVAEGNLRTDLTFKPADILAVARMMGRVDPERQERLQKIMDQMRGRLQ
jgi:hypothetical protein